MPSIAYSNKINQIKNFEVTPIFGGYRPSSPPPMKNTQFFTIFCHTLIHRSYIPNLVNLGQILRIFTFGGSKKAKKALKNPKKAKKWLFSKIQKKCVFPSPKRSYIPSFMRISPKLRPVALEQTNRQTNLWGSLAEIHESKTGRRRLPLRSRNPPFGGAGYQITSWFRKRGVYPKQKSFGQYFHACIT